ncbi:hypothetical protein TH59_10710 [Pantoea ananatis]|nr:hypothetical protein [Pantoea ananatis]MDQ1224282.1 hypothetical protein [Pantoea ananatis]MDR6090134.1 hypothetical protein [Pantoea ananatis]PQK93295.1 hypothetical protein CG433_11295 [Pantoea ananatis]PQL01576.1 hypothetical protein CG434_08685 [Pantoea ananatis]
MTTKYFALLTNQGAAKLANAAALGTQLQITQMAVGDGGGVLPTPDPAQTKLVGEKRRAALNSLKVDAANSSQIIAEQIIPEGEGGFWIREIGLYDADGVLIAVANCAETYKPQLQEGSGRTQTVRMILIVNSTSAVTLKIDPSVVLATRQYVDDKVIEVKAHTDDVMKKHIDAANPHGQYLQTAKALAEIKDAGLVIQARKNLELGSAALSDLQTSKNDVTAGRVLVNGGAVAVQTVAASSVEGFEYKDANDLPANAVSFVYTSAKNSPGFDGSLLSYAGLNGDYQVQLSVEYQTGNRIAFRGMNGDDQQWQKWNQFYHTGNKPTARDINAVQAGGGEGMASEGTNQIILGWDSHKLVGQVDSYSLGAMFYEKNPPTPAQVGAIPATGGSVAYLDGAEHYATQNASWPASGAYADQYKDPRAPFVKPFGYAAPRGNSCYSPIIKGLIQTEGLGYGTSVSFGALTLGDGHFANGCIHVIGDNGFSQAWLFDPHTGNFNSPGAVYVGGSVIDTNGNINGAAWGGWLSDWLNTQLSGRDNNISNRATWSYVDQNFVRDIRLVSRGQLLTDGVMAEAPGGAVITGGNGNEGSQLGYMYFRYMQKYVNGNWYTVAYA